MQPDQGSWPAVTMCVWIARGPTPSHPLRPELRAPCFRCGPAGARDAQAPTSRPSATRRATPARAAARSPGTPAATPEPSAPRPTRSPPAQTHRRLDRARVPTPDRATPRSMRPDSQSTGRRSAARPRLIRCIVRVALRRRQVAMAHPLRQRAHRHPRRRHRGSERVAQVGIIMEAMTRRNARRLQCPPVSTQQCVATQYVAGRGLGEHEVIGSPGASGQARSQSGNSVGCCALSGDSSACPPPISRAFAYGRNLAVRKPYAADCAGGPATLTKSQRTSSDAQLLRSVRNPAAFRGLCVS